MNVPNQEFITIDIGNNHVTAKYQSMIHSEIRSSSNMIFDLPTNLPLVISSVIHQENWQTYYPQFHSWLQRHHQKKIFLNDLRQENTFLGMPTAYAATLGEDRLAVAFGAYASAEKNTAWSIIIDAGSLLTMDLVSQKLGHSGGYILPGLTNYKKALESGDQLKNFPLFQKHPTSISDDFFSSIPNDTLSAMEWGYIHSVTGLLLTKIAVLPIHDQGRIILTGGDTIFWHPYLAKTLSTISNLKLMVNIHFIHDSLSLVAKECLK